MAVSYTHLDVYKRQEWYFTDVFTDRRIPQETSDKIGNVAMRLGGALFVEDFRLSLIHI